MSEEKYEVTKEAILKMAKKCPEAKEALKAGFPKAFGEKKTFDLLKLKHSGLIFTMEEALAAGFNDKYFLKVRSGGKYGGIAFYLEEGYLKWELKRDGHGSLCLTVEPKN
ncbi:hypothetical protein LCGC14_1017070 [marine sediment metagenome]|uniref:Uncharacterized protein n=1 Tax=marine sediment metagenome TaxID=412755 RepID=A0A0F9NK70_9ZZZZ